MRTAPQQRGQPEQLYDRVEGRAQRTPSHPPQAVAQIALDAHMGKQTRVLKYVADTATLRGDIASGSRVFQHFAVDFDPRGSGPQQSRDDVRERRLAASGAPEQRDHAGRLDLNRHVEFEALPLQCCVDLEHQRPSIRATRRLMNSAQMSPKAPSTIETLAKRAASASPSGVCNAV
jgi:hypothetical protein